MGRLLAAASAPARKVFECADRLLAFPLSALCFEGPQELLDDTVNTQPALFVTCLAALNARQAGSPEWSAPAMVAGHSLGEITALVAAGAIDFEDGLRLVRERGRLMKLAGQREPGGMAAVLKMEDGEVERACAQASSETGRPVQVANYNCPGQVVISGDSEALKRAADILRELGAKRIVPLAVSIAAHSPLMAAVVEDYRAAVDATPIRPASRPVVGNVSGRPLSTAGEIRSELADQLTRPVRWTASVQWMVQQGITRFVEVGPKDVLTRLVQRIDATVEAVSVGANPPAVE